MVNKDSHLEIVEIPIESPKSELKLGDDFFYSGTYFSGYEEGFSKIERFYRETFHRDGVEYGGKKDFVWMQLENGKLILLGFYENGEFLERSELL